MAAQRCPLEFKDHTMESAQDPLQRIKFGALYEDKPAVIAFLRRLGCQICRVQAQDLESIRPQVEALGARMVCVSFEHFGEGSDSDRSFQGGGYFKGDLWTDPTKALYEGLFKRKGLLNGFYGLMDMSKDRMAQVKERGVPGNYKGDGFRMGGLFVLGPGDAVHLDHRQTYYGDDPSLPEILAAVRKAVGAKPDAAADAAAATGATSPSEKKKIVCEGSCD